MATAIGLTIEEFEQLPDALARNHELIDGELVDVSGNTCEHISLRDALIELLRPFVRHHKLGKVLAEQEYAFGDNAHGPDLSFVGDSKVTLLERKRRVQRFVPDMAVEVVSENDKFNSLLVKALLYRSYGTAEVFIISIDARQIFYYSEKPTIVLDESQEFRSEQIPGFSIRISDLFAMI
jgi:Uma2 family endonuclease